MKHKSSQVLAAFDVIAEFELVSSGNSVCLETLIDFYPPADKNVFEGL